jgi:hypothetical protein
MLLWGTERSASSVHECGVRRGVAIALTMAQAATDMDLQDIKGFPMGEELGDYEDLVTALVLAD